MTNSYKERKENDIRISARLGHNRQDNMNTTPTKRVSVTLDGERFAVDIPAGMRDNELLEAITLCKRLMAEFYFTSLVMVDSYMLLFEQQLLRNGAYRHMMKKNFKAVQQSVRKLISLMRSSFSFPDYFEELSAGTWDEAKDDINRLQYAVFLVFGRNGYGRDEAETYATLTTLANIIYMAFDTYNAIIEQTRQKTGVRLTSVVKGTSCERLQSLAGSWCRSCIRNFDEMEQKVVSDGSVVVGRDAYSQRIVNAERLHDREVSAFENLDENYKVAWKPMSERPKNRRRVIVFHDNKTFSYLYDKGFLYGEKGKVAWESKSWMWIYENEKNKKADFVA